MEQAELPDDVHADYANEPARDALAALLQAPDFAHLADFLNAAREGYLVVDVTGTAGKKRGPRVRTIRSTSGKLVLPLFTSMAELRAAVPAAQHDHVRGAVLPAREALSIIVSDRFVAAEFDKASTAFVVLRKFVTLAAAAEPVTADALEALR